MMQQLRWRNSDILSSPTVVEVTEVPGVEEEMCPEQVPETAFTRSEGQRGVEVQAPRPIRLSPQIITWKHRGA